PCSLLSCPATTCISTLSLHDALPISLTLVRLPEVRFPPACQPAYTEALVVFDPAKAKPDFYLRVIPSIRGAQPQHGTAMVGGDKDRKSTRLNSSHVAISYAVFCLKKK